MNGTRHAGGIFQQHMLMAQRQHALIQQLQALIGPFHRTDAVVTQLGHDYSPFTPSAHDNGETTSLPGRSKSIPRRRVRYRIHSGITAYPTDILEKISPDSGPRGRDLGALPAPA
ncbi:MAG: hypothetical protein P8164_11465 [Gammaproteobacteria bacterium]